MAMEKFKHKYACKEFVGNLSKLSKDMNIL
jgi:hypothetical protein